MIIGTQGLFGVQPDGLTAIWLVILGLPWTAVTTPLVYVGLPMILMKATVLVAPILNIWLLSRSCKKDRT